MLRLSPKTIAVENKCRRTVKSSHVVELDRTVPIGRCDKNRRAWGKLEPVVIRADDDGEPCHFARDFSGGILARKFGLSCW